jgi:hypothetical protein
MVNGRTPYYLILAAAVLFVATFLSFQPYSVTSPWEVYTTPARRYLEAAARGDSLGLSGRSSSTAAVRWALEAFRRQPESLAVWAQHAGAWAGNRRGDTAEVFLGIRTSKCDMVLEFVGSGGSAKVARASSACFEPR